MEESVLKYYRNNLKLKRDNIITCFYRVNIVGKNIDKIKVL